MLASGMCALLFFFFQAEDGIRDLTVTGVQTCALPISPRRGPEAAERSAAGSGPGLRTARAEIPLLSSPGPSPPPDPPCRRSEERRVGKECRSRWSAYQ